MRTSAIPTMVEEEYSGVALVQTLIYDGELLIAKTQPSVVIDFAARGRALAYWPANGPKPIKLSRVLGAVRDSEALIVVARGPRRLTYEVRISPAWMPGHFTLAKEWKSTSDRAVVADHLAATLSQPAGPEPAPAPASRTYFTVTAYAAEGGAQVAIGAFAMRDGPREREAEYVARHDREAVDVEHAGLAAAIRSSPTPAADEASRLSRRIGPTTYSEPAKRRAATAHDAAVDALAAALAGTEFARVERGPFTS